jgi:hypothetical protein
LKQNDIKTFPIPLSKLTDDVIAEIGKLYVLYDQDAERNEITRQTAAYSETKQIKEYKMMNARDFAHKIDGLICPLYALTGEEREFSKNYEIEFRVND